MGNSTDLLKPWRDVINQSQRVQKLVRSFRVRWRELDNQMKELNLQIIGSKRRLTEKLPCFEISHFRRLVEKQSEELANLKASGE